MPRRECLACLIHVASRALSSLVDVILCVLCSGRVSLLALSVSCMFPVSLLTLRQSCMPGSANAPLPPFVDVMRRSAYLLAAALLLLAACGSLDRDALRRQRTCGRV